MNALRATGMTVRYGGVQAVADVDLELHPHKLVGLIGPNGAGKTSLIDAVTGFTSASGRVFLGDRDITRSRPDQRARAGLMRTWQSADLFEDLTVRENLLVSAHHPSVWQALVEFASGRPPRHSGIDRALELMDLRDLAERRADELTEGQRKLVAVARSLAPVPSVLCLDEPAAGLDAVESRELGKRLRRVLDTGIALLLIDHDMDLVMSVCDELVVLDFGRVIARGTPEAIRNDPDVLSAYLGASSAAATATPQDGAEDDGGLNG
ncbi:ABC transporter ATP-binding protein [Streptomyces sp. NPDC049906]|uniref:ABC transporter ATP-binding protein n=1 Tax=Streptomyces sp. NPDC049906 TaxID=3155656 RepID=UPI0034245034